MPIVGFHIKRILAEKRSNPQGRIDINSTPYIVTVNTEKVGFAKKEPSLDIGFEFVTNYEPKMGEIKIEGSVMYLGKTIKNTLNSWKKDKRLPPEIDIEVKNFLFKKCMTIGINLSEDMHLPPPMMFPNVAMKKPEGEEPDMRYIG